MRHKGLWSFWTGGLPVYIVSVTITTLVPSGELLIERLRVLTWN